jgi:hypothetical protein
MFRPKLTKIAAHGQFGKAINQLNRAVSNQSNMRPGSGLGMSSGPFGNLINLNSPILMYAKSVGSIDAATDDSNGDRTMESSQAYPAFMSLVGDKYVLRPDKDNPITVVNMTGSKVDADKYILIARVLDVWVVLLEDCGQ